MAPHSSTLAWKIPWMEEPGRLQSMGSLRVGHNWATSLSLFTFLHWRRKWQPTPVFLPGESQGRGAWWAAVYGVAQSWTWLKWLSSSSSTMGRHAYSLIQRLRFPTLRVPLLEGSPLSVHVSCGPLCATMGELGLENQPKKMLILWLLLFLWSHRWSSLSDPWILWPLSASMKPKEVNLLACK